MEEYIGVIVRNQWDDILFYDKSFYIKTLVTPNKDIKEIIKECLKHNLNKDIFKIRKIYEQKLQHKYESLTMYLVDVGVYSNDFEFMKLDDISKEIYSFEDKAFFDKNLLRHEECNILVNSIINLISGVFILDILSRIDISLRSFFVVLSIVALSTIALKKILTPRISNHINKLKFNIKIANTAILIIIVIYCIKVIKL
ncbi:MAG: hypothetical protein ACRC3Y_01960 [Romboutsia sp.]